MAHAFHHVGTVIGGGTINAEAECHACEFQLFGAAMARGKYHVGRRAVRNTGACFSKALHFLIVKMNAMGQPGSIMQPAGFFQIIKWSQAEGFNTKTVPFLAIRLGIYNQNCILHFRFNLVEGTQFLI